jgi:glucosyl-dolichyl phosphate glucuronosyltransferase
MPDVQNLTVAICTHDRAWQLQGALEALAAAAPPMRLDWEALVILNACHDESAAVVESFKSRLPIRAVAEPRPGISMARNRAVECATGDFILWIDDDVRVTRDWLRRYEAAILAWPDASVFGGKVCASPEAPVSPWFYPALSTFGSVFGNLELPGFEDGASIAAQFLPIGANYAIRTEVQRRYRYDPDLGRVPGRRLRNHEETSVLASVLGDGHEGRWIPSAQVEHVIPPGRQTTAHVRAYFLGNGILKGLKARAADRGVGFRTLIADSLRVAFAELRYQYARRFAPPQRWSRHLRYAAQAHGEWLGKYGPRPFPLPSCPDL